MNAQPTALLLAALLLVAGVAGHTASATPADGCGGAREEGAQTNATDPGADGGADAPADAAADNGSSPSPSPSPEPSSSPSQKSCIVIVVDGPGGPCTVVRKVGDRPSVSFDPLLGMVEVDPDNCVQRVVRRAVNVDA